MENNRAVVKTPRIIPSPVGFYRAVFLSPHWDDAVFSSGGHLAHLEKEGRVLVVNLFTDYPTDVKAWGVVASAARAAEERAAAKDLGFESFSLKETDAVCREQAYRSLQKLFGDPLPSDLARLPGLTARLNGVLSGITFKSLYIPLAVGWHIDHQMTHLAARDWWDDPRTLFYEDMPYALVPNLTGYRLRELGILPGQGGDLWPAALQTARGFAGMAPIQNRKFAMRWGAGLAAGLFLARQLAVHRKRWVSGGDRWTPVVESISDTADRKREAAFRYASQVAEFFRGEDDWKTQFESASLGTVERYWKKGGRP